MRRTENFRSQRRKRDRCNKENSPNKHEKKCEENTHRAMGKKVQQFELGYIECTHSPFCVYAYMYRKYTICIIKCCRCFYLHIFHILHFASYPNLNVFSLSLGMCCIKAHTHTQLREERTVRPKTQLNQSSAA